MKKVAFYLSSCRKLGELEVPEAIDLRDSEGVKELEPLQKFINQMLDAENLVVLSGSGSSLTFNEVGKEYIAPSMGDLWNACKGIDKKSFKEIKKAVKYEEVAGTWPDGELKEDIELLLSLCDAYLPLKNLSNARSKKIQTFLKDAKIKILEETSFVHKVAGDRWASHNSFVRTLGKRSPKQKRLKLFTTNYDLAFETAASNMGFIVIDGFEFSKPQRFNPAWYNYDIVNRTQASEKGGAYLSNIIHLYKMHGSVDWMQTEQGVRKKDNNFLDKGEPVFIYPSSAKYQSSYDSPYIDMMAAFLEAVQKPKTAVLCVGFGFNDKHINNAISMALRTNPELMVMVATKGPFDKGGSFNAEIRQQFMQAIDSGDSRIAIADCTFDVLAELLPNRHLESPEEALLTIFEKIISKGSSND